MKLLFWLAFSVALYTIAVYPLAIAVLARYLPKPWQRAPWPLTGRPPVSIVMAVHNGAGMLPAQLARLQALDPALVNEMIVISDGSDDGTNSILEKAGSSRLRVILLPEQVGKAAALNHGIKVASAEILVFIDVRPRLQGDALSQLLSNFHDASVGCVTGELLLNVDQQNGTTAAVSGLYWRYEQWIRNNESAFDSTVGVYGGFYAVRRSLATLAPNGLILDDMFQPLSVIRQGYRAVVDKNAIVTDRWPEETAGEFRRKVRTLAGNFQLIVMAPWVLAFSNRVLPQLASHKLLRLVAPYSYIILFVSAALLSRRSLLFALIAILQGAFWAFSVLAIKHQVPWLDRLGRSASAFLLLNAAAVAGLFTFCFTHGPLWKIWVATPGTERVSAPSLHSVE